MKLNLNGMTTERRNPRTMNLDTMSELEIVTAINDEDARVPLAIAQKAARDRAGGRWAVEAFEQGGRLFYMGAGTSGRLGVLDAAECPPTFGVDPGMVVGLIAGGEKAFLKAIEGAEDSRELGRSDLEAHGLTARDFVVGIAASGRNPLCAGRPGIRQKRGLPHGGHRLQPGQRRGPGGGPGHRGGGGARGADRLHPAEIGHRPEDDPEHDLHRVHGAHRQGLPEPDGGRDATNEKLPVRAENIVIDATGVEREEARQAIDAGGRQRQVRHHHAAGRLLGGRSPPPPGTGPRPCAGRHRGLTKDKAAYAVCQIERFRIKRRTTQ